MKPIVDKILSFTISKTLSVVVVATVLEYTGELTMEWVAVAVIYIGGQKAKDILTLLKK